MSCWGCASDVPLQAWAIVSRAAWDGAAAAGALSVARSGGGGGAFSGTGSAGGGGGDGVSLTSGAALFMTWVVAGAAAPGAGALDVSAILSGGLCPIDGNKLVTGKIELGVALR